MGYTQYHTLKGNKLSKRQFDKIVKDVKVIEQYIKDNVVHSRNAGAYFLGNRVTLHDGYGEKNGIKYFKKEKKIVRFVFNGDAKLQLDHESFLLGVGEQESFNGFCKTARKPYDLVVCMVLLSLQYHVNTSKVSSDGNPEDWDHAIELWQKLFPDRNIEILGLTRENPELYIVRLEKKVKPMKVKKDAFNKVFPPTNRTIFTIR